MLLRRGGGSSDSTLERRWRVVGGDDVRVSTRRRVGVIWWRLDEGNKKQCPQGSKTSLRLVPTARRRERTRHRLGIGYRTRS